MSKRNFLVYVLLSFYKIASDISKPIHINPKYRYGSASVGNLAEIIVSSLVSIVVAVVLYAGLYPTVTSQITATLTNASSSAYVGSSLAPLVSLIPTLLTIFFAIGAFFLTFQLMRMGRGRSPL